MKNLLTFLCLYLSLSLNAQDFKAPKPTAAAERTAAFQQRQQLKKQSLVQNLSFRSVGPSVFGGRVTDLEVYEADPSHFYVAYASGGLWKTENNGTSFYPIFDKEAVMTIGDIAVNWQDSIIWIGTGEVNSSRSSYAGNGIYKSTDNGENWQYLGLGESHHIARIILHPTDANTAWVAALGHLYSPNKERGIFKTSDGGKTWQQVFSKNENTGAIDLVIDPDNPDILYTATWHRERRAWNFVESGEGSGIHKSVDGGQTWTTLSTENSGFPSGSGVGRIGLGLYKDAGQTTLYAILDNYDRRPEDKKENATEGLTKDDLRTMSKTSFLQLDPKKLETYLSNNGFPEKYSTGKVIEMVKNDQIKPIALVEYLEDANALLFDTPVIGAEIYRFDPQAQKWNKTHDDYLDFVYNSYGYYFGQIRVSPHDADKIYFAGVPVIRSEDGGKTFININRENVHVDHHAIWLNPNRDKHLILGNDGGVNISYDDGENWVKCNTPAVGQFYAVAVDMAKPYNIYGGLQDNGVWVGSSTYSASPYWHNSGHYPYKELLGGDGMQIAIDNRDNNTVYTGFQFGWYYRINKTTEERTLIKPSHELTERPLRFNWQTPIHLSIHNQDILYLGSNKLHRSMNQGDDWTAISSDLTKGGIKGDVAFGTLTTIDESPFQFGLLYVGTDDGNIHMSKDGGQNWTRISDGLPQNRWVTTVYASRHDEATVYASLNGYRWDEFDAYIYVSQDYGSTWKRLGNDLPLEPVNVILEDTKNPNLIYVGTDNGLYCSLDKGTSFMLMDKDLPAVAVHDVVVHPRAHDLIVGTHGRSIYLANIADLQALTPDILAKTLHAFPIRNQRHSNNWGKNPNIWRESYDGEVQLPFYSKNAGKVKIQIETTEGLKLHEFEVDANSGLNYATYDYSLNEKILKKYNKTLAKEDIKPLKAADNGKYYLAKGSFIVKYSINGVSSTEELKLQ